MSLLTVKAPWYATGLTFECNRCGRCCSGPEDGYVWLKEEEVQAISAFLQLPLDQVGREYVRRVGDQVSLKMQPSSKDCVFLSKDLGGATCRVHPVRPVQCRTWPFWDGNLRSAMNWWLAGLRCKGLNHGRHHTCDEIERQRQATRE